ncbi:MAG: hypothetical protein IAF38_18920 [Bacteroidia bacterium]|nr:hypothetical protein [Bacteroidia bacterium]
MTSHTELIEKYLSGELNSAEKEKFERELNTNEDLKEELELQKLILKGIERDGLKTEIRTSFRNARRRNHLIRWGGVAGILLIAIASYFIVMSSPKQVTENNFDLETKIQEIQKLMESTYEIKPEIKKDSAVVVPNKIAEVKKPVSSQKKIKTFVLTDTTSKKIVQAEAFKIPAAFLVPQNVFKINPLRDTILVLTKKDTKLHIPKLSFVDSKGQQVKEIVDITYREYTNAAEMAFSGIPMTYKKDNVEYNFNSSGMFELEGTSKGEKVEIDPAKNVQIDYALAKQNPDIDFYYLNKSTGAWEMKQEIKEEKKSKEIIKDNIESSGWYTNGFMFKNGIADFSKMSKEAKAPFIKILKEKNIWPKGDKDYVKVIKKHGEEWENKLLAENIEQFGEMFGNEGFNPYVANTTEHKGKAVPNNKSQTLLGGGGDLGHTYPPIISELNVDGFGVYNCDQIYRIGNFVSIKPKFVDNEGNEIKKLHVLSMIDLKYNGAFSFDPRYFNCDPKSDNVLMLFTNSGKLYSLNKDEFKAMNITTGGEYSFKMTDVTDKIKTTSELKNYLGLK